MIKVEVVTRGSLFHYAHFICDCLLPEIILKLYEKDEIVRAKNIKQTLGNFGKIYEQVMSVKNTELPPKKFVSLQCEKIVVQRNKNITIEEINFFRNYIFNKFNITPNNSYPEVILIERGERVQLIDDKELQKLNNNVTTGKERREIDKMDELKLFLSDKLKDKFKTLVLENVPFVDQIKYFFNAKLIIGIHGAALSNLLFCQPSIKVLEVLGDRQFRFFDIISAKLKINHQKCENDINIIKQKITELYGNFFFSLEEYNAKIFDILTVEVMTKKYEVSKNKSKIPVPSIFYIGMEKSGSKSMLFGFKDNIVAHWHSLEYFESKFSNNLLSRNNLDLYDFGIYLGKKYNFKPLFIESIREPISQLVSAIVQHFKRFNMKNCKCAYCKKRGENMEFIELVKKSINVNNWLNYPEKGFQSIKLWKKHFNMDLLSIFQKNNCYYDLENAKILLLRLEDADKREKVFEKIGYQFKETHSNKSEDDDRVAQIYKYIKDNLRFTDDELNSIYSKEVKIFYKDEEINEFKKKWVKKN